MKRTNELSRLTGVILVCLCLTFQVSGQAIPNRPNQAVPGPARQIGRRIISPEVQSDNKVTFRIYAPKSASVAIIGDWVSGAEARENLVRNDTGLWVTTLGPLPAGVLWIHLPCRWCNYSGSL